MQITLPQLHELSSLLQAALQDLREKSEQVSQLTQENAALKVSLKQAQANQTRETTINGHSMATVEQGNQA